MCLPLGKAQPGIFSGITNYIVLNILLQIRLLGISHKTYTIAEAVTKGQSSIILPWGTVLHLVCRNPTTPTVPRHSQLWDCEVPGGYTGVVVDEAHGYRIVLESESVLFYRGGMSSMQYLSLTAAKFLSRTQRLYSRQGSAGCNSWCWPGIQ